MPRIRTRAAGSAIRGLMDEIDWRGPWIGGQIKSRYKIELLRSNLSLKTEKPLLRQVDGHSRLLLQEAGKRIRRLHGIVNNTNN